MANSLWQNNRKCETWRTTDEKCNCFLEQNASVYVVTKVKETIF